MIMKQLPLALGMDNRFTIRTCHCRFLISPSCLLSRNYTPTPSDSFSGKDLTSSRASRTTFNVGSSIRKKQCLIKLRIQ